MIRGKKSNRQPFTSDCPWRSTPVAIPFNMFISNLGERVHSVSLQMIPKYGGVNKIPASCVFLLLDKLEKWVVRNLVKFNEGKHKS